MATRANYFALAPKAMQILLSQEQYLHTQFSESETMTPALWHMVKLRVSQINQCAFCIDMHTKEAARQGESWERMLGLSAWRDMPLYTDIERTVLGWAEHLTAGSRVEDEQYQAVVAVLGEQALVDLTLAVNAINSWNRVAKTFKPEVGSYQP